MVIFHSAFCIRNCLNIIYMWNTTKWYSYIVHTRCECVWRSGEGALTHGRTMLTASSLIPRYTICLQQTRVAWGSVSSQSCTWISAMGSRGVRPDGLIPACSNRLLRLGGRNIKKANERIRDLPSLRTAKFLTSLEKCVTAMAKLSGTTFEITCICMLRSEERAGQHAVNTSTRTLILGRQYWWESWSPLRHLWNSLRCRADEEKKTC